MFTRRQAIRWAELWLACWNEGDYDTLLALYKDTARFRRGDANSEDTHADTVEALRRHWDAVPRGVHAVHGDLERVAWDPDTRELTIVYATHRGGSRVFGCDLVTLDTHARVVLGEPCIGCVGEADLKDEDTREIPVPRYIS